MTAVVTSTVREHAADEEAGGLREPVFAGGVLEDVLPRIVPGGDVEVIAGRPTFHRPPHERGDEPVHRGDLLDRQLQEMRVISGLERTAVAGVDLPLRRVVLLVRADEREAEPAYRVLHRTQDSAWVDARVHAVHETRL